MSIHRKLATNDESLPLDTKWPFKKKNSITDDIERCLKCIVREEK